MVKVLGNEIFLHGTVGRAVTDDEGASFDAADVRDALHMIGKDKSVTIHLNSPGGSASEGLACHSVLTQHRGRKTILIEGIAASAGSVVACAGDDVVMTRGAVYMLHCCSGITIGDAATHHETIRALDTIDRAMLDVYTSKTKRPRREIEAELGAETWLDSASAVAKKYADRVDAGGIAHKPAAFAWHTYNKVPAKIAAMAGTARLSAAFGSAVAAAAAARDEAALADFIRDFYPRHRGEPSVEQALAHFQSRYPAAVARALSRPAGVISGPWRRVVDRQNAWVYGK